MERVLKNSIRLWDWWYFSRNALTFFLLSDNNCYIIKVNIWVIYKCQAIVHSKTNPPLNSQQSKRTFFQCQNNQRLRNLQKYTQFEIQWQLVENCKLTTPHTLFVVSVGIFQKDFRFARWNRIELSIVIFHEIEKIPRC